MVDYEPGKKGTNMLKRIVAAGGCIVLSLALVACGGNSPGGTGGGSEQAATTVTTKTINLAGLELAVPSDWIEKDNEVGTSKYLYASDGGYYYLSYDDMGPFKEGVVSALDGFNKAFIEGFADTTGGKLAISNEKSTYEGVVRTFTYDVDLTTSNTKNKGLLKYFVSGNRLYTLIATVPSSSYDDLRSSVEEVVSSAKVSNPEPPNAAGDKAPSTTSTGAGNNPAASSPNSTTPTKISEGTYKVGTDIEPGEYKLTATRSSGGYWEVNNSSTADADIVGNDNFSNSTYVTVSEGQYLKLSGCIAEKVQ